MAKFKVPEEVTHVAIAGRVYDVEDSVLDIDEAHDAAIMTAARNGFPRLADGDKKTVKPARKTG